MQMHSCRLNMFTESLSVVFVDVRDWLTRCECWLLSFHCIVFTIFFFSSVLVTDYQVEGQFGHHFSLHLHRHATISWGKSVFVQRKSVSIRILHVCIDVHSSRDSYRDAVYKKSRHCVIQNRQPAEKNQNQSFRPTDRPTSRGATVGLGLRL